MAEQKTHILVVEDDPAILRGLLDVLVFNGYQATGREDGREGLDTALADRFDLVILDVMLPSLDGFSICRELRLKKPDQPIMMLTAKGSEDDIVTGFTAGADDYVNKPFSLRELMVRVEALLRRSGKAPAPENLVIGPVTFDSVKLVAVLDNRSEEITRRELDIISYLHKNRDRIISKQEFLSEVWNYTVTDIETRTVDIHIQKLRKKLSRLFGDTPLIVTVRGEGYRLEPCS
ncbi:MAG: response regulator transcription factor [Proteobacteria bacterium]|nr:response regulator transcription factor [Pseudomonadota bacterium]MBU1737429.1 response regulator transcription factor [Pseudomonadota bacterium]